MAARVDFDIEIHLGAGAYVCGEETALLESLEGKRGVPRNRPPYPVTHGYLQQPTVVNNVETLCAAALIALGGAERYRSLGTGRSPGTKLLAVAGDCTRPGVYEFPFGVTVQQVLEESGAAGAQAVQVGGPSGVCIDASEFGRRIAFEDLACAGAITVFGPGRDLFEVARNYTRFFAHESCGFCTPCRVGTSMLAHIMDKIHAGNGSQNELEEMARLNSVLLKSAHCGLGHTACNPVLDTLKRFRPSYVRRLGSHTFTPGLRSRRSAGRGAPRHRPRRPRRPPGESAVSDRPTFVLDGTEIPFEPGQTVLQAALAAGRYIPHLCYHPEFEPHGSCKLCTAATGGRTITACTRRAEAGMEVQSNTEELNELRRTLVQMLFAEGNHFCPSCEKSGNCRLQASGYDLGVMAAGFRHLFPDRPVDASHPELLLDFNRCILCELCVRASRDVDGKSVFALSGRGIDKHLIVNSPSGLLRDTDVSIADKAVDVCPVGVILRKGTGFEVPIGQRRFDLSPISAQALADAPRTDAGDD